MGLFFPSFFDRPTKIRFAEQERDENIELMLRQHWVTNVPWIITVLILIMLPGVFVRLVNASSFFSLSSVPTDIIVAGLILWYLGVIAFAVERFLYWYFNIYIVTNRHLVDVDFYNITYRDITEIQVDDIQSVSSTISGVIRSLFGFGDVIIETAAKDQDIEFEDVPKPDLVADRIEDIRGLNESHFEKKESL